MGPSPPRSFQLQRLTKVRQVAVIDPSAFRTINELLQKEVQGRGKLETLSFSASTAEGDEHLS